MKAAIRPNALWHSGENGVFECEEHYASDVLCQVTERGNFASLHVSIVSPFVLPKMCPSHKTLEVCLCRFLAF